MKVYLEPDEIIVLENQGSNLRDQLLIRMLFHLGCRVSEALGITVEDVDLVKGTVTIEHLKMRMNLSCPHCDARIGKSHIYCPNCGARVEKAVAEEKEHRRVRTLPLDDNTLKISRITFRVAARFREKAKGSSLVSIVIEPGRWCGTALRELAYHF